ncbi:hydroxyacid dehydrogenase [Neobacillus rhizosphaerae]|uniref:hydroxyacid dehydrogenase n=1 Tax=Neobacillus rhizosphaerae TaxID=2880965 RepID=UPI003D2B60B9
MESIFLVKDATKLYEVYSNSILKKLKSLTDIDIQKFYTEDSLTSHKHELINVKYIFSTWYMPKLSEEKIKEFFPNLKGVFYAAGTVKYFAEPYLKRNVRIFSANIANAIPVAEFVTAQIILANKGYFQAQALYKKRKFKKAFSFSNKKTGNYNCTIGLIGAGNVGANVIELLKPYNIRVLVYDPYLSHERAEEMGCTNVSLETLFSQCDVISNHLPDNPETKAMLSYRLFSKMKENATFINTGRGAQVVEKDLARILKERPYTCALLDVTVHEPLWPHSPFYRLKNVFITPHIAGSIKNEEQRMAEYMLEAYQMCIAGDPCPFEVTNENLENMA